MFFFCLFLFYKVFVAALTNNVLGSFSLLASSLQCHAQKSRSVVVCVDAGVSECEYVSVGVGVVLRYEREIHTILSLMALFIY